jgi:hypothetical protein
LEADFDLTYLIFDFKYVHDYANPTHWEQEYEKVFAKYQRRIAHFLMIMKDPTPLIIFTRYTIHDCIRLKSILNQYKTNITFINATPDKLKQTIYTDSLLHFNDNYVFDPSINNKYDTINIWKQQLQFIRL